MLTSNEILENISENYKDRTMETGLLAEWNLINIINRVLSAQNTDLNSPQNKLCKQESRLNQPSSSCGSSATNCDWLYD